MVERRLGTARFVGKRAVKPACLCPAERVGKHPDGTGMFWAGELQTRPNRTTLEKQDKQRTRGGQIRGDGPAVKPDRSAPGSLRAMPGAAVGPVLRAIR